MRKIFLILCSLFFLTALFCSCESKTTESSHLKVYVLDGGSLIFNNSLDWFTHGDEYNAYPSKTFANPVFLIEHSKGRLIWDVGLDDKLADRKSEEIDSSAAMVSLVKDKLIDQLK